MIRSNTWLQLSVTGASLVMQKVSLGTLRFETPSGLITIGCEREPPAFYLCY